MTLTFSQFYNLSSSYKRYKYAVSLLYKRFGAKHCIIGKFVDNDSHVKSVFYALDGHETDSVIYPLSNSPCSDAKDSDSVCCIVNNLQQKYLDDKMLVDLDINGYLGVTLRALDHKPIGIMVCLFESPNELSEEDKYWFQELSYVVAAELNHNLEMSSQSLLLKQLEKGETIASLCSWSWNLTLNSHNFSAQSNLLLRLPGKTSIESLVGSISPIDRERLKSKLLKIQSGEIQELDIQVSHTMRTEQFGLFRIVGHVDFTDVEGAIFTATIQDVSYLSSLNNQLELTNVVFEHATEAIMITDRFNAIVMVNRAFEKLTGYTGKELKGKNPSILSSGKQAKHFYHEMWKTLLKNGHWKGEIYNRRKNGQVFPEELTLSVVNDEAGTIRNFVAIFRDITEWKENEAQLTFYANHETLTGLLNRRSFMAKLEEQISFCRSRETSCSLLFIGLDNFKEINDIFGPEVGDKVLISVAKRLMNSVRREDIIARYGGDEFTILLRESDVDNALHIAKKLNQKLCLPYVFSDISVEITATIGVSHLELGSSLTASKLLRNAAHALSSAKSTQKGQVALHNEAIQSAYLNKIRLRDKLKQALKKGQLSVHYQPIISFNSKRIEKFEALVRWFDDDYGMVSPAIFIPIAEEFGLIHMIGQFVLEQSCKDLARIHQLGFKHISVSINRSVNEFKASNNQLQLICDAIESHNLPYESVTIEVTESMAANKYTWQMVNALREKGIEVALDDFCTGYSSLSNLIENQVDYLKIDKSFIDSLIVDSKKQILVTTLVDLSRRLGLTVIAEGVESLSQLNTLRALGCHAIQGFYFSPAKPIEDCIDLIRDGDKVKFLLEKQERQTVPVS